MQRNCATLLAVPEEPLHTTTFTLTRADALAYEQAAGRLTPLGVLALLCWLGLFGALAMFIPPDWAGPRLSLTANVLISIFVATGYVMALLVLAVRQWLAARRRLRRPVEITVGEWPDRLDIASLGLPRTLPFAEVRRVILTRTHLLLETDAEPLIIPRRAFPEEGSIEALAGRIESAPRAAPPPSGPAPVDRAKSSA